MHWRRLALLFIKSLLLIALQATRLEDLCQTQKSGQLHANNIEDAETEESYWGDTFSGNLYERSSNSDVTAGYSKLYNRSEYYNSVALKEIMLHAKLKKLETKAVVDLLNCQIIKDASVKPDEIIVLNFETFNDITQPSFQNIILSATNPSIRIRTYLSAARAIRTIHAADIIHCGVLPSSLVSTAKNYSSLILKDLVNVRDLEDGKSEPCSKIKDTAYAKDIHEPTCQKTKEIQKADIWSLGMIILQIEASKGQLSDSFFITDPFVIQNQCYSVEWTKECENYLSTLISKTFKQSNYQNPQYLQTFSKLEQLVIDMLVGCESRLSAAEVVERLGDLVIAKNAYPSKNKKETRSFSQKKKKGFMSAVGQCFGFACEDYDASKRWKFQRDII